jgi:hypothetical protein
MKRPVHVPSGLTAFAVGLVAAWASLTLGFFGGGPLMRQLFGPPRGLGEDYTTWQGVAQAVSAQGLFLIPVFALCGYSLGKLLSRRSDWTGALLIANPVNVFGGYWLCYELVFTNRNLHVELLYFRPWIGVFWGLMSMVVLAPVARAGLRFRLQAIGPILSERRKG